MTRYYKVGVASPNEEAIRLYIKQHNDRPNRVGDMYYEYENGMHVAYQYAFAKTLIGCTLGIRFLLAIEKFNYRLITKEAS